MVWPCLPEGDGSSQRYGTREHDPALQILQLLDAVRAMPDRRDRSGLWNEAPHALIDAATG
jgi:hypothetical protein